MAEDIAPAGPVIPIEPKAAEAAAELSPAELRASVAIDGAELKRAAETDGDSELLGQSRAIDAIRLAIGIDAPGYNVFVSGLRTRIERDTVLLLLAEKAATMPTPGDWVYVNNFRNPDLRARSICAQGRGASSRSGCAIWSR